jgi:hypothetical protein
VIADVGEVTTLPTVCRSLDTIQGRVQMGRRCPENPGKNSARDTFSGFSDDAAWDSHQKV